MAPRYGHCDCGGAVREERQSISRWKDGDLFIIERVPIGVCVECGERIFKGPVLEQIEQLISHPIPVKKILAPVLRFAA